MTNQPDRRRGERLAFHVPVTLRTVGSEVPKPLALTENLGRGGVGVRLFEPSGVGMEVTVNLHLFGRPSLLRAGRIAWIDRERIPAGAWKAGIAFYNELAPVVVTRLVSEGTSESL